MINPWNGEWGTPVKTTLYTSSLFVGFLHLTLIDSVKSIFPNPIGKYYFELLSAICHLK